MSSPFAHDGSSMAISLWTAIGMTGINYTKFSTLVLVYRYTKLMYMLCWFVSPLIYVKFSTSLST
jgi:hypothetical protein